MDGIEKTVVSLRAAFDDHFTHAFAAKANCLHRYSCCYANAEWDEVASPGEFAQARRAGFFGSRDRARLSPPRRWGKSNRRCGKAPR